MNTRVLLLSLAFSSIYPSITVAASDQTRPPAYSIYLEAKGAYFYPTSHTFREIYGQGGGIYGIEATFKTRSGLAFWASSDYFHKSGHSIGTHNSTDLTLVPIGGGIKFLYSVADIDLYLGGGILGGYLRIHNHSPYVVQNNSKWGVGGIAKAGVIFNFFNSFFLDLFANYSYLTVNFHNGKQKVVENYKADVSNCTFGAGIGYRFGPRKSTH